MRHTSSRPSAPAYHIDLFALLAVCAVAPFALSLGPSVLPPFVAVLLTIVWGVAYAMPFYTPAGEFAMQIGGKSGTALFTNIFDAAGFAWSDRRV